MSADIKKLFSYRKLQPYKEGTEGPIQS